MKSPSIKLIGIALVATALFISHAMADPYATGSKIASFTAKDQYEKEFTLKPADTRFLMVSHDMETGKKANAALTALGKEFLGSNNAVYVANIHGMPGIGRMFAIPKMKKYAHRIILGDDAALMANFPHQEGKVTVLALSDGKVQSIRYWTPGTENVVDFLK